MGNLHSPQYYGYQKSRQQFFLNVYNCLAIRQKVAKLHPCSFLVWVTWFIKPKVFWIDIEDRELCPTPFTGPYPDGFWVFPRMETPEHLRATCCQCSVQNVSLDFPEKELHVFQFVPITSGHVTGHCWKGPGSIFSAPPFSDICLHRCDTPGAFSSLQSHSSLSLSY